MSFLSDCSSRAVGWIRPGACFGGATRAIYLGSCRCVGKSGWKLFRLLKTDTDTGGDCKDLLLSISGKLRLEDPSQQQVRPLYSRWCSADHLLDKPQFALNVQFSNLCSCAEGWLFAKKTFCGGVGWGLGLCSLLAQSGCGLKTSWLPSGLMVCH